MSVRAEDVSIHFFVVSAGHVSFVHNSGVVDCICEWQEFTRHFYSLNNSVILCRKLKLKNVSHIKSMSMEFRYFPFSNGIGHQINKNFMELKIEKL